MSELSKQALKVDNNQSFPNNNNGAITPSILRAFNVNMIDSLVDEIGYTADSASWNQQIDSLEAFTASAVTSAITASSLITASFDNGTRNLTFTKGNNTTFAVNIPDVSGSEGSFLTTASFNSYTQSNDQRVSSLEANSASVNISITQLNASSASQQVSINNLNTTSASVNVSITNLNASSASQQVSINSLNAKTGSYATTGSNTFTGNQTINAELILTGSKYFRIGDNQSISTGVVGNGLLIESQGGNLIRNLAGGGNITLENTQGFIVMSGSATQIQQVDFIPFSASLDSRINTLSGVTSSYVTETESGSFLITASFASQTLTFTKGDNTTFSVTIPDVSGSTINTGSFATTGSNVFTGDQTFTDASGNFFTITDTSGSMMLVAKGFTSASAHITSSAANKVNIIFKNNNNTATTYLSGSNNIFVNSEAPTSGFKRIIGSSNINLFQALPQVSASMGDYVSIDNNFLTARNTSPITVRGPISSSAWEIKGNVLTQQLNIGTSAANHAQGLVSGLLVNNCYIGSNLSVVANRSNTTQQANITNSNFAGAVSLVMASSSIDFINNTVAGGTVTINNNTTGSARVSINQTNAVFVSSNILGGNTTITLSGSNDPNDAQDIDYNGGIVRSLIHGSSIAVRVNTGLTGSNTLSATTIIGNNLIVTGSSQNALTTGGTNFGSAFFGRYNSVDGNKALSADTVFAVGAGSNLTTRKTPLRVSSSAMVLFEGETNFSGNMTFTDRSGNKDNVIIGSEALGMGTSGAQPNALGNTIAVAIGNGAMRYASGSNQNTAIGNNALLFTTGSRNTAIGSEALSSNTSGQENIGIGVSALTSNITGSFNVAIGNSALFYNQTDNQIAIGALALKDTTTGWRNTAIGYSAAEKNTTGESNVAIGGYAMYAATGSENNIAIGYAAMESAQSTDFNTAIGVAALQNAKSNSNTNVAIGGNALRFHYDGDIELGDNMAIGYDSMANMTSGSANVAIGTLSLRDPQRANENTFIGYLAAYNAQTASDGGAFRLNVGIGSRTGLYSRGYENTFIGTYAGNEIREGNQNTFVGARAGINIITGSNNTLLGRNGGVNNWNNVIAISDGEGSIKFFNSGSQTTLTNNTLISGSLTTTGSMTISGSAFINNLQNGVVDVVVTYNTTTGELRKATVADILSASLDAAEFWSTTTQSGSAGVSGSITFNNSGSVAGISLANNSRVTVSQAGTYNIQFSAQIETSAGADTVHIWFKKNGNNIAASASKAVLANNTAQIMTVNLFDEAVANDYYELGYQTLNGNATVLAEAASGNIPAIPSVILTIQQIR